MELTPKEKARHLLDTYIGFVLDPYDDPEMGLTKFKGKKNVLICINEIQANLIKLNSDKSLELFNYYQDVKKELETL